MLHKIVYKYFLYKPIAPVSLKLLIIYSATRTYSLRMSDLEFRGFISDDCNVNSVQYRGRDCQLSLPLFLSTSHIVPYTQISLLLTVYVRLDPRSNLNFGFDPVNSEREQSRRRENSLSCILEWNNFRNDLEMGCIQVRETVKCETILNRQIHVY